jgi:hypothetical protein
MNKLNNGYLMTYINDTIVLVKTMVVKLEDAARLMNEGVVARHSTEAVDPQHPETWKYYLNVSGQYHPTDRMMRVVSIDTLEEIDFTLENLRIHTATAEAYQYGTRQHYALVAEYPDQEFLINGILSPADLAAAIQAEDGRIIAYRKDLVEVNEHSLMEELERFIQYQIERWYNTQFNMSSELYCAGFITQLYTHLVTKVLNLRLKRLHSYETHSFHVRMFLASHNGLDRYLPYLTLKQALWLYRNIRYIERNAGKLVQFYRLIDQILTERGIPISEYEVRQQDSYVNYFPKVVAKSTPLNTEQNTLFDNIHPLDELFLKEAGDAPDNQAYLNYNQAAQAQRFETSNMASVQTKVLLSSMVDYSNAVPEPFEAIALRQWCKMAFSDQYESYVTFKDPKTSLAYSLKAKDAFFYMQYLALTKEGLVLEAIPEYLNLRQRRHPKPTVEDLLRVVDTHTRDLRPIAEAIVAGQPVIAPCFSTSAFNKLIYQLYDQSYWHWFLISSMEDVTERALVENMIHQLYEDERIVFSLSETTVAGWLAQNNLPAYTYSPTEADLLIKAIYEAGSGLKVKTSRILKNVQRELIGLLRELSSYSIQFVREINEDDLIILNWPAVRFGNQKLRQEIHRFVENGVVLQDSRQAHQLEAFAGAQGPSIVQAHVLEVSQSKHCALDPVLDTVHHQTSLVETALAVPKIWQAMVYQGQDVAIDETSGLPGLTSFEHFTENQKQKYRSIYH